MGMKPDIKKKKSFLVKTCNKCGGSFGPESFSETNSLFYPDGYLPICDSCVTDYLKEENFNWRAVNKICQYMDIPFVPQEFERLHEMNGDNVFSIYVKVFHTSEYEDLGWEEYFEEFKRLKEDGYIEDELPLIREEKFRNLREKWGANYDDEELLYLEGLYKGLLTTQNINGALQVDQAKKLCKISLTIDSKIRAGEDFDKILSSYEKLTRTAEFTPKNVKNANDFDSTGEIIRWLEKRGWVNKFYDDVTRDIVDETMKNIQTFNQRLYTNESGIGDEIDRRITSLKTAKELEDYYDVGKEYDLEEYEIEGFNDLMGDEEFEVELDDGRTEE